MPRLIWHEIPITAMDRRSIKATSYLSNGMLRGDELSFRIYESRSGTTGTRFSDSGGGALETQAVGYSLDMFENAISETTRPLRAILATNAVLVFCYLGTWPSCETRTRNSRFEA